VTDRIDHTATPMPALGTRVMSLQPAPAVGTWEAVEHERCAGNGRLKALTRGEAAPLCEIWVTGCRGSSPTSRPAWRPTTTGSDTGPDPVVAVASRG